MSPSGLVQLFLTDSFLHFASPILLVLSYKGQVSLIHFNFLCTVKAMHLSSLGQSKYPLISYHCSVLLLRRTNKKKWFHFLSIISCRGGGYLYITTHFIFYYLESLKPCLFFSVSSLAVLKEINHYSLF